MLKKHSFLIGTVLLMANLLIATSNFITFYLVLHHVGYGLGGFAQYAPLIFMYLISVWICFLVRGFQADRRLIDHRYVISEVAIASIAGFMSVATFVYLLKLPHLSRLYLAGGVLINYFILTTWNIAIYLFYKRIRIKNLNYRNILLIGNSYSLPDVVRVVQGRKKLGFNILGFIDIQSDKNLSKILGLNKLGEIKDLETILNKNVVDVVVFTVYRQDPKLIEDAMLLCKQRGITVWLKPDFMQRTFCYHIDYLEKIPLVVFSMGPQFGFPILIKRSIDVCGSLALLSIFLVPIIIFSICVKTSSKGPVFFKQKRVGLNSRRFIMYKFRTMYEDSEQRRNTYTLKNEMGGPVFKMKKDPRITRFGLWLRKYSMDELPQLWNVLKGDMSLVGPRPPLPTEVKYYRGWQRRRLSMPPGITCIWQISGRNKITNFDHWVELDLKYIDEWSLWLDIKILLKTVPAVLRGTGV